MLSVYVFICALLSLAICRNCVGSFTCLSQGSYFVASLLFGGLASAVACSSYQQAAVHLVRLVARRWAGNLSDYINQLSGRLRSGIAGIGAISILAIVTAVAGEETASSE